jgi:ribonuclease HII
MTISGRMILGIDEAGRGPVIGPLVVCGVWIPAGCQPKLHEIGVRDSKLFGSSARGQRRRAQLAEQIRGLARCVTLLCVDALEVDRRTRLGELNVLERELAEVIINAGPPTTRIFADGERIFGSLTESYPQLEACDGADAQFPVVAAASIVAKVERDARFQQIVGDLDTSLGPIRGGGYANRATADFLQAYVARHGQLPAHVRRNWSWAVLRDINRQLAGARPLRLGEQLSLLSHKDDPA